MDTSRPVKVALLGGGTVGGGVARLLRDNAASLAGRVGRPLELTTVLVRDLSKARSPELEPSKLTTDPELAFAPDVDVVVEVMGGEEPARSYIERALRAGKSVVTANKFVIAKHGPALVRLAVEHDADLAFEASVGGGMPVVRVLREALVSDTVDGLHAILNGTCNYVLTRMRDAGLGFDDAVKEAQQLGYAEADPSLDVDGHDAGQKLLVAAMLAFGAVVPADQLSVEGIRAIDQLDFAFAARFGFTLKHLAIGRISGDSLELRVHPTLIEKTSVLANVDDVLNAVFLHGRALGPCLLVGRGAGALPTAVSVVSDVADVARSRVEGQPGFTTRGIKLTARHLAPLSELSSRYYLRFDVADHPGVLGRIAGALGDAGVSIQHMVQEGRASSEHETVPVLLITHQTREAAVRAAFAAVASEPFLRTAPRLIRIEDV